MAVFTIVSNNYLHFARTLLKSVRVNHPDACLFCVIVDRDMTPAHSLCQEFEAISIDDLGLPNGDQFTFQYTILELNTAVKPWAFELLMERGFDEVLYVDPDIYVYHPLSAVRDLLAESADIVLTPHLLAPITDEGLPGELEIRRAGTYNLGFCALRNSETASNFLRWWRGKLERDCVVDMARGIFVDQSWIDLVPGLFARVAVLRHPGYNVAYWNLSQRALSKAYLGQWEVDGFPLTFFHFSGFDPLKPSGFSKHQNRFSLSSLGPAKSLVEAYGEELLANGAKAYTTFSYGYGYFGDCQPIPNLIRSFYRNNADFRKELGEHPYSTSLLLNAIGRRVEGQPITWAMLALWSANRELQQTFPLTSAVAASAYLNWFVEEASDSFPRRVIEGHRRLLADQRAETRVNPARLALLPGDDRTTQLIQLLFYAILRRFPDDGALATYSRIASKPGGIYKVWRDIAFSRENKRQGGWIRRAWRGLVRINSVLVLSKSKHSYLPGAGQTLRRLTRTPHDQLSYPVASESCLAGSSLEPPLHAPGLNIVGYVKAELGVGEAARSLAAAASKASLQHSLIDVGYQTSSRQSDISAVHSATSERQAVDLLVVNADQTAATRRHLVSIDHWARVQIGFWHWEQLDFPKEFLPAFEGLDEVWTPSAFVQEAVSTVAPVPVVKIPNAVHFDVPLAPRRKKFGLPADKLIALLMYDFHSFAFRKNPEAAIQAYRLATEGRADTALAIKTSNAEGYGVELAQLKEAVSDLPNVIFIDEVLSRADVYELQACCDVLLSLHRAEGFGLIPAEFMFLGKPVIATGWSGNMEFMTMMNSFPVQYTLKPLARDLGPYRAGSVWAEADVEHAAWCLRRVLDDHAHAAAIGAIAAADIRAKLSPEAIGRKMSDRLLHVASLH